MKSETFFDSLPGETCIRRMNDVYSGTSDLQGGPACPLFRYRERFRKDMFLAVLLRFSPSYIFHSRTCLPGPWGYYPVNLGNCWKS